MDINKAPPLQSNLVTIRGPGSTATPGPTSVPDPEVNEAATLLLLDPLHIEPLDVAGALRILVAEVRAGLPAVLPDAILISGYTDAPVWAPQTVIQLFLRALPLEVHGPASFLEAARNVEADMQRGLDNAVSAVVAWRAVPTVVVDAVREARTVVLAAMTDDPPNPLWLRPEWLGLAPAMERFRRRRRWARRAVSDPDLRSEWLAAADSDTAIADPTDVG